MFIILKNNKKFLSILLSIIVISIIILTWFFPFSYFSVYKSYNYNNDSYAVKAYSKKLTEFKKFYNESSIDDGTTKLSPGIFNMFEQDWLVTKGTFSMNKDSMNAILIDVKNAREHLLELTILEDYTSLQRHHLLNSIKNLLSLEVMIEDIKNQKWETRNTFKTEFHNLQDAFFNSFNIFISFYRNSQYK